MDQSMNRFGAEREALLQRLFPQGFPSLWCPLISHYAEDGSIDRARMRAQLHHLAPNVGGFLIPGSTGDGWEMSKQQSQALVEIALQEVGAIKGKLLIGALAFETQTVLASIEDSLALIRMVSGASASEQAIAGSPVCGFTVCAPRGRDLGQDRIRSALDTVLALGVPVSLYQLPQVTENEISPQTIAELAAKYPNFYMFKDTGGSDRVANWGFDQVLMLRGAEGAYAEHLAVAGGTYDGFMLSAANGFSRELKAIRTDLEQGNTPRALALSRNLGQTVEEIFELAQPLPHGNAFANANKALDHFCAYGPGAACVPAPWLCAGHRLPKQFVEAVGAVLTQHRLMPTNAYLV